MTTKSLILITFLLALPILSTDIYLPSLTVIQHYFQTDYEAVQLTLSVYFFTFAVVQLIYGSLSDCFGRKPMTLISLTLYLAGSFVCIGAGTIHQLIMGRGLQALGAGSSILVFAMVRDRYEGAKGAQLISYMSAVVAISPIIAPIMGGYIQGVWAWQGSFVLLALISSLLLVASFFFLPETHAAQRSSQFIFKQLVRDYRFLLTHKVYMAHALCAACAFAALFSFISGAPYIFLEKLGYGPEAFGWTFAMAAIGYVFGAFMSGKLSPLLGVNKLLFLGLSFLGGGAIFMITLCFFYGVSGYTIIVPQLICELGISIIVPIAVMKALTPIPQCAGAGSALIGFMRFFLAMISSFLTMIGPWDLLLPMLIGCFATLSLVSVLLISQQARDIANPRLREEEGC